ncbi:hypothetical protein OAQ99_07765 [Candidatus Kapabacteria bacterium]|nr:hypothetical protein [Candidatus Kapabacteria bacterium]
MTIQEHEKFLKELKEYYKNLESSTVNKFKEKYPNSLAPFNSFTLNVILHLTFSLELIGRLGAAYEQYSEGGALFVDALDLLVHVIDY